MVADSSIVVEIKPQGNGARVIKRDLDQISDKGERVEKQTDRMNRGFRNLSSSARLLAASFVGLAGALGVRQLSRFSDQITTLETRLKNVTNSVGEFNQRFDELFVIAQNTGDSFNDVVDNFVRLNTSLPEAVKNTTDLTKVTDLLSRGFAASGASAQVASSVLTQLTQGLAGNFANASQELNSLVEGTPLLAKIIAEELGGRAATDLKKFAQEGKLTTESFLEAVIASEAAIKAYEIPPTISRSVQRISNEIVRLGSESSGLRVISGALARALDSLATNMENIVKVAQVLALTSVPFLIKSFAVSLPAALALSARGFDLLTAAMLRNPFGALAVALTAVGSSLFVFRDEIAESLRSVNIFGVNAGEVFNNFLNVVKNTFVGVAAFVTGLFNGLINVVRRSVAQLEVLLFQLTDNQFARRLGFDPFTPSLGALRRAEQSIGESFSEGFNSADGFFEDFISTGISNDIGAATSGDVSGLNIDLSETLGTIDDINTAVGSDTKSVFEDAGDTVRDTFKTAFDDVLGDLGNWISDFKGSFNRFITDIAQQAARPIILNIVAGVTGAAGGFSLGGLFGGGSAEGSSGGGLGSIGSLFSAGRTLLNGGFSTSLASIGNGIGNLLSGQSFNFIGPTQLGGLLGQSFGNLGFGAIGSLGANLLGLGSGNALVDGGLGTLGAVLGGLTPLGPIGSVLGSFAGTALGGLFGGSTPSGSIRAITDFQDGQLVAGEFTKDETTKRQNELFEGLQQGLADSVNSIVLAIGGTLESAPGTLFRGSSKRDGNNIRVAVEGVNGVNVGDLTARGLGIGNAKFGEAFTDPQEALDFAISGVLSQASIGGISDEVAAVLRQSAGLGSSADQIITDVGLAQIAFGDNNPAQQLVDAIELLNEEFATMIDRADELGLPLERINDEFERQKEALLQPTFGFLQDFLDDQALSSTSSSNPLERLSLARAAFDENINAINSGDLTNLGSITNQASTLLSLGRDAFASGEGFTSLESFVRQQIAGIDESLGIPGQVNDDLFREITLSNARNTSLQEQQNALIEEQAAEIKKLRKEMERIGNQLVAS